MGYGIEDYGSAFAGVVRDGYQVLAADHETANAAVALLNIGFSVEEVRQMCLGAPPEEGI